MNQGEHSRPERSAFRDAHGAVDWARVRAEFPAAAKVVYVDAGRKVLPPKAAAAAAADWFADLEGVAPARRAYAMQGVEETRRAVGETFGAAPETIALLRNTSEGINIVAQGLDWRDGDNLVISAAEHENNTFPWRLLARRGIGIRIVPEGPGGLVSTDSLRAAIDARTRVLAVAWVSYGLGQRADLDALADICRRNRTLFLVDAIQAVGVLDRRLDALGADVVAAGGHKGQMSVSGAGLMYVAPEVLDRIEPTHAAKFSFATDDRTEPAPAFAAGARRFEYGNPNFLGLAVQRASARFIAAIGLDEIEARVRHLTTRMIEAADRAGLRVRTPRPWAQRAGIVSFDLGGRSADAVEAALAAEGIFAASKDGHLRAAAHIYNSEDDVDAFVARLRHHLRTM